MTSSLTSTEYQLEPDVRSVVLLGDSLEVLAGMPENSVDAVIADPPYALTDLPAAKVTKAISAWVGGDPEFVPATGKGFMARSWDGFVPPPALWSQVFRVLKPGGHAAVFAGARTQDLMGISLRLAGFDVRPGLQWLFGSGMPKGKGQLKPAFEPILLFRKPFRGTAKANVARWGVGELFTERCRIPFASAADERESKEKNRHGDFGTLSGGNQVYGDYSMLGVRGNYDPPGRWPASIVLQHDERCVEVGRRTVRSNSHHPSARGKGGIASVGHKGQDGLTERRPGVELVPDWECVPSCPVAEVDRQSGGASRFWYTAKASAAERPSYVNSDGVTVFHPTVKPLSVIRWLARLLCPPGGMVLDPFAGSGTTGEACLLEGFGSILIEREPENEPLIRQRLERCLLPSP